MKTWVDELVNEKTELQIAPLIDVVFLLLIYFMVSAQLKRTEADLDLALPGAVSVSTQMEIPDEQIIEVLASGEIVLNNKVYVSPDKADLAGLEYTLLRYAQAAKISKTKAVITIAADDDAVHERVIDVLNACAGAGIKNVTFGTAE
ncbi:ExbD/TolR family protein [Pontiella agarivorans]|uniref:Biopolymer transporter ExbD n=1 Tax=Pontiella agarivorans TaxID=3038953 RepID=A0ABU5MZZ3_9BACT|nr:biopolymer transporter ExbD [Pontiella agarivorans]MDZ8119767.1 biopolymer transporter ExbD [Pontiella agarivorans]